MIFDEVAEVARRTARVFPENPRWTAFVEEWLAGKRGDDFDGSHERDMVRRLHEWRASSESLVREAPCVEETVVGSDQALSYRSANMLLASLAFDDEVLEPMVEDIRGMIGEARRRLDRVEASREPRQTPRVYRGPVNE